MYNKILVPLDGSPLAETVLPYAEELARAFESQMRLRQVVEPPIVYAEAGGGIYPVDITPLKEQAERYLTEVDERLEAKGLKCRWVVLEEPVAEGILDYAELEEVDLIAMSTHGRSGLGRWLYGSVAQRVLQGATCPILLIRAKK